MGQLPELSQLTGLLGGPTSEFNHLIVVSEGPTPTLPADRCARRVSRPNPVSGSVSGGQIAIT